MSGIENRIKKLEQSTGVGNKRVILPVVTTGLTKEQAEA